MRAMTIAQWGPPSVLTLGEVPEPSCGEHDLLVEVIASSVNPVDTKIRSGRFRAPRQLPIVPGYDVCGRVAAVGAQVQRFGIGDEVYAYCNIFRDGAHAERVAVDARAAAIRPRALEPAHAAAVPLVLVTAWEALHEKLRIAAGDTVLIQGGAGGVGHLAIQLARRAGCRVLATASRDASKQLCRDLGADEVIDYRREDVAARVRELTAGRDCEAVFDCAGGEAFGQALAAVAAEGRLATIVGVPAEVDLSPLFLRNGSLHTVFIGSPFMHDTPPDRFAVMLEQAAHLLDTGKLRIHVSETLPLEQLPRAHELLETQHTLGKIAIVV